MKIKALFLTAMFLVAGNCVVFSKDLKWHSADSLPLLGKAVDDASTTYRYQRLPDSLKHIVKRPALYGLGHHNTGLAVRFATDSPVLAVEWTSRFENLMEHMPPVGTRGLDVYLMLPDSSWTFLNSCRPELGKKTSRANVISNMDPGMREYMIYLSLYDGVDTLNIGIDSAYSLTKPRVDVLAAPKQPIVVYGTSLVHGGCVNRPGMTHVNQLGRRLNREVINLGFGGNGQLDPEIAEIMAAVPDPALFVLDFVPNCTDEQIDTLMEPFVDIIRAAHPDVPILFVENLEYTHLKFDNVTRDAVNRHNALLHKHYDILKQRYDNLYMMPSHGVTGLDGECTVDGVHLTDLGAQRFADALEVVIRPLLPQ